MMTVILLVQVALICHRYVIIILGIPNSLYAYGSSAQEL